MVTIADYRYSNTNITRWGAWDGHVIEDFPPSKLMQEITERIENDDEIFYTISNLSTVGLLIIYSFLHVGYNLRQGNPKVKDMHERDIKYMAASDGSFYSITIKRHKRGILIIDSNNLISLSERNDIIDSWGDPDGGYNVKNYVKAVRRAVRGITDDFDKKKPCTIASAARKKWQAMHGDFFLLKQWVRDCRLITVHDKSGEEYFRPAYHGGLCLINYDNVNPDGEFKDVGSGLVLDINGMYPWIMSEFPLPYGQPHEFKGKPSKEALRLSKKGYIYFFVHFKSQFDLKPDGVPCVSISGTKQSIMHERGWLTTSKQYNRATGEYTEKYVDYEGNVHESFVELTLTQTDFSQFLDNYNIHKIEYIDGVWFPVTYSLFKDYVTYWQDEKFRAEAEGNIGKRRIAKMFENSLSGNMARHTSIENMVIRYDKGSDTIGVDFEKLENVVVSHVHIGAAITSYGRGVLINYIKKYKKYWLYSDTDSLHFKCGVPTWEFSIGNLLGQFKIEKTFTSAYYYKQKMYAMKDDKGVHLTFAGVPKASIRYLEDLLSGKDPETDPKSDFIEPKLTEEQTEAVDLLFAGNAPEDFDEIMSELTSSQSRFTEFKDEISKGIEKGDPLKGLYFLKIPVWEKHTDETGAAEKLHVIWRPVAKVNKWAQM
ncbi:MAG: hypothetical protein IKE94_04600 [Aeriscardovia sp.]|nr:hypothetical protein [Aeriscardovia sp.]